MRRLLSLALIMPIALIAIAAAPALQPVTIGSARFAYADILDGRATFDVSGAPVVMLTFKPAAAKRLQAAITASSGKPIPILVDGKPAMAPIVQGTVEGNAVQLSGAASVEEAVLLARRISGKAPLPDSLDE